MSEDETTITTNTEAVIEAEGCILIPVGDLPAGSVITITVTVGAPEAPAPEPAAPQKARYMTGGRNTINGGAA